MRTEHRDQASFCPFALREVSVLAELALGHLRYSLTDVPPQSNSPPGSVLESDHTGAYNGARNAAPRNRSKKPRERLIDAARARRTKRHSKCLAREHRNGRRLEGKRRTRSALPSK